MKLELTRQEMLELWKAIHKPHERALNKRFEYALAKNRIALKNDIEALKPVLEKKLEGQEEYEKAAQELLDEHTEKDDKGNAIQRQVPNTNQTMVQLIDPDAYNEALQKLREEHKAYVDSREQYDKETDEWLRENEKITVEVYGIKFDYLPDEFYNKFEMEVIMPLLIMDEKEE